MNCAISSSSSGACFAGPWPSPRASWSLAALYHFGTRRKEHWGWVLARSGHRNAGLVPGNAGLWLVRNAMANYTRFYGSFAAGIATLVWLYLTSFSALLGAELNGAIYLIAAGHDWEQWRGQAEDLRASRDDWDSDGGHAHAGASVTTSSPAVLPM